jgi:hypothetical protein
VEARSRIVFLAPLLTLILSFGWDTGSVASTDRETMLVPGGIEAVSRLMGNVDADPERFASSLNRILLRAIRADHDWEAIDARVDLMNFLETIAELESRLSFPLELDGPSPESLDRLDALASVLGFMLDREVRPFRVEALEGEENGRRQRIAWALGWNLTQIAHRIGRGEVVTLDLHTDHVTPLVPLSYWEEVTHLRPTPASALHFMVTDQKLGLVAEGTARMTRETRDLLGPRDLRWLYERAPVAFYRYSTAFEVRDGALRFPGGSSAAGAWAEWIGVDPGDWRRLMRVTLTRSRSEPAHVWSALFFLPDPVARYFAENFISEPWTDERVEVVLQGIRSVYGRRFFNRARGLGGGFQLLYRAVPFEGNDPSPRIPENPGLWCVSMRDGSVPRSVGAASKIVSKSTEDSASPEEYLTRWMSTRCRVGRTDGLMIERYLRTGRLFERTPALSTPENIYFVNRAAGRFPSAVDALHRMRLTRPGSVRDYLIAVARLGEDVGAADRLVRFQGGVELLARMYEAGRVEDSALEAALGTWARLHDGTVPGARLEVAQAAWLRALLEHLPAVDHAAPGRGPLERAWLAAMAGGQDPQVFEWNGLAYEGHRGRDRAERMFRQLLREGVPPVDDVLWLEGRIGELQRVCEAGELERAREIAADLLRQADAEATGVGASGFAEIRGLLAGIREERKSGKLSGHAARLTRLLAVQAARLRPILVAPAYLPVLTGVENVLITDQRLVGRHVVVDRRAVRLFPWTGPWQNAEVVSRSDSAGGAYISGHLGEVTDILIRLHVRSLQPGSEGRQTGLFPREACCYRDVVCPAWSRISPQALDVVESLVRAGSTILEDALSQIDSGGPAFDFVSERIPLYRLEKAVDLGSVSALVTPSDRLALGLAAVVGDDHGGPAPELLGDGGGEDLGRAVREVGRGPAGLDAVAAPTPHVNGRHHPWVGTWLPYEAFDREGPLAAMVERELVDLRTAIALYLARNGLPGSVGADLESYVVARVPQELELESAEDWESVLEWIARLNDAYFDRGMRWCLERGYYRVQDS